MAKKGLKEVLENIKKEFKKPSLLYRLGDGLNKKVERVSSRIMALDIILGGGITRGITVEVYGAEGAGKTTLALNFAAEIQRLGGMVAYIDTEHALDPMWAKVCGVKVEDLLLSQPDSAEEALNLVEALVKQGVDLVVLDSVASLAPQAELDGKAGESYVGVTARLMNQHLRKSAGIVSKGNSIALYINQLREKIGVKFGNPETTPGGKGLKYYASIRFDVRRVGKIEDGSGIKSKITVVKSKISTPFRFVEVQISELGINTVGSLLDSCLELELVKRPNQSSYVFGEGDEEIKIVGRSNCIEMLESDEKLRSKLSKAVMEMILNKGGEKKKKGKKKPKKDKEAEVPEDNKAEAEVPEAEVPEAEVPEEAPVREPVRKKRGRPKKVR